MHSATDASNTAPLSTAHLKAIHQSAAIHAARMIRHQYAPSRKNALRRECIDHLRASLGGGEL